MILERDHVLQTILKQKEELFAQNFQTNKVKIYIIIYIQFDSIYKYIMNKKWNIPEFIYSLWLNREQNGAVKFYIWVITKWNVLGVIIKWYF